MVPLLRSDDQAKRILVSVLFHRTGLWPRGLNQSALIASELSRTTGLSTERRLLRRVKRTPAHKGMSLSQRKRVMRRAFSVGPSADPQDATVVLAVEVLTTGSTANACAKALKRPAVARSSL